MEWSLTEAQRDDNDIFYSFRRKFTSDSQFNRAQDTATGQEDN